uniref:Sm domain-containing protein n=1 Tax=Heligmosomoides polygyrus TaxID=6339 RepID=A0A183G0J4_HELPZ
LIFFLEIISEMVPSSLHNLLSKSAYSPSRTQLSPTYICYAGTVECISATDAMRPVSLVESLEANSELERPQLVGYVMVRLRLDKGANFTLNIAKFRAFEIPKKVRTVNNNTAISNVHHLNTHPQSIAPPVHVG